MTPRPGRIAHILDNPLPRPRNIDTYEMPMFIEHAGLIRKMILASDTPLS